MHPSRNRAVVMNSNMLSSGNLNIGIVVFTVLVWMIQFCGAGDSKVGEWNHCCSLIFCFIYKVIATY